MMPKNTEARAATRTEIVMPREGGPEVLEAHRRHLPGPGPGQVMVRAEAAGVSFAEMQMLKAATSASRSSRSFPATTWWAR